MIKFDHIEVHVKNSEKYSKFLKKLFRGGRLKKISKNNTYMFLSNDDIHIEVKERNHFKDTFKIKNQIDFCLPCLRLDGAYKHLSNIENIVFKSKPENHQGTVYFFQDYEGVDWHFKDFDIQDKYINI